MEEDDTSTPSMKKKKLNALFASLRGGSSAPHEFKNF
jgi:hypothetical protein